jgi:hypothetical protein
MFFIATRWGRAAQLGANIFFNPDAVPAGMVWRVKNAS